MEKLIDCFPILSFNVNICSVDAGFLANGVAFSPFSSGAIIP